MKCGISRFRWALGCASSIPRRGPASLPPSLLLLPLIYSSALSIQPSFLPPPPDRRPPQQPFLREPIVRVFGARITFVSSRATRAGIGESARLMFRSRQFRDLSLLVCPPRLPHVLAPSSGRRRAGFPPVMPNPDMVENTFRLAGDSFRLIRGKGFLDFPLPSSFR